MRARMGDVKIRHLVQKLPPRGKKLNYWQPTAYCGRLACNSQKELEVACDVSGYVSEAM
jgi:hypothetical protein